MIARKVVHARGTERPYRYWTRDAAIAALQRLSARVGRTFARSDIRSAFDCPSEMTVIRMFGSIRNAQIATGGTPRAKHCPRRERCRKGIHPLTPDNLYIIHRADGSIHRRCRRCVLDYSKAAHRLPVRVVRPDVAKRHAPEEMARFWGVAS